MLHEGADKNDDLGRSKCLIGGTAEGICWSRFSTNGSLASQTTPFFLHVDVDERRSNTRMCNNINLHEEGEHHGRAISHLGVMTARRLRLDEVKGIAAGWHLIDLARRRETLWMDETTTSA